MNYEYFGSACDHVMGLGRDCSCQNLNVYTRKLAPKKRAFIGNPGQWKTHFLKGMEARIWRTVSENVNRTIIIVIDTIIIIIDIVMCVCVCLCIYIYIYTVYIKYFHIHYNY